MATHKRQKYTNCTHLFANDEQSSGAHGTHNAPNTCTTCDHDISPVKSSFTIAAEPPPTCEILDTTCKQGIAKWQGILRRFNRKRKWYNKQYGTNYNPPLWKWVTPEVWTILSADMVLSEDATDPSKGEPPNDNAVTDLLLQRGKYTGRGKRKVGAHGYQTDVLQKFSNIKWSTDRKLAHTARLDKYLTTWFTLASTIYEAYMPPDKPLCAIMLQAIQPEALRRRVWARMYDGCGPDLYKLPEKSQLWRKQAKKQLQSMRRLIREQTQHLDDLNSVSDGERYIESVKDGAEKRATQQQAHRAQAGLHV